MKTKFLVLLATACGAFLLGGGVVLAAGAFTTTPIASGTIARAAEIEANGIEFSSPSNSKVAVVQGDFEAGSSTGWHTHPGLTVVVVKSGTVTNRTGCNAPVTYGAGASFVEPPNTPINVSAAAPARVITTLIFPSGMASRTDVNAPVCSGPPADD
jgi:quercetin dioxygenase-like cupin family protein